MFAFIFEIIIFVCLAILMVIALRALPRVSNEVFTESRSRVRVHELMIALERVDDVLKILFEKFLRRLKVLIMKLDNIVTKKISKFKNERTKEKATFLLPSEAENISSSEPEGIEEKPMMVDGTLHSEEIKKTKRVRRRKVQL
jgi:hypothetical protein